MDRVVAENPAVTEFRRMLATQASELGDSHRPDEIDAGLKALAKARDQVETVRRTNPNDVRNLYASVLILRGIGKARANAGEDNRSSRSRSVRRSPSASGSPTEDNLFTYQLACVLALYGDVVGRAATAAGKASNDESRRYSDRAMEVLRQAVDRGYREADLTRKTRISVRCAPALISRH